MDSTTLIRIIAELYNPPFDILVEAAIGSRQWVDLKDWESNQSKWAVDENGRHNNRDYTIDANDLVRTAVGGASISKSKYVFLPMTFALGPQEGEEVVKRLITDIKSKGSVRVSTWPGYGVEGESAYPAMVVAKLPAEERSMMEDQFGHGGVICAVDGVPLSQYMVKAIELPGGEGESEADRFRRWVGVSAGGEGGWRGESGPVPEWLIKMSSEIDAAIRAQTIKAEIARIKGFEGELILSTPHGDAVMLVSKQYGKAAYVFRKKMNLNGAQVDYDVAISTKMTELMKDFKRKPRGQKTGLDPDIDLGDIDALKRRAKGQLDRAAGQPEYKRPPRFVLRDWLEETDNGYALYRDVRAEDIRRLMTNGINFEDGRTFAESPIEAESGFSYNLSRVLSEDVVMESEQTIQSFLDVMYSPWSMDEHKLFGYLKTLSHIELDDWVSALEIVVEQGEGDRWIHGLTERTLKELNLTQSGKARAQGILVDLQASPVDDPMPGPAEPGLDEPEVPPEAR